MRMRMRMTVGKDKQRSVSLSYTPKQIARRGGVLLQVDKLVNATPHTPHNKRSRVSSLSASFSSTQHTLSSSLLGYTFRHLHSTSGFHSSFTRKSNSLEFFSHQMSQYFHRDPHITTHDNHSFYGSFLREGNKDESEDDSMDMILLEDARDDDMKKANYSNDTIVLADTTIETGNFVNDSADLAMEELQRKVHQIRLHLEKTMTNSLFHARILQREEEMRIAEEKLVSGAKDQKWMAYQDELEKKSFGILSLPDHMKIVSHDSPITFTIFGSDIHTLKGLSWLNDVVINSYFALMFERSQHNPSLPKVWVFNSFFFKQLSENGYGGVKRWAKKAKPSVFAFDLILVPVHVSGNHWCCGCISLKDKTILYYDSMGGENTAFFQHIRKWLVGEGSRRDYQIDLNEWQDVQGNGPQQDNTSDCGVFASQVGNSLAVGEPLWFHQSDMPRIRKEMMIELSQGKLRTSLQRDAVLNAYELSQST
eukprot:m.9522 g.9522  ORF g.9522 m.9522 type:complete len:479 (+) comp3482_c0_seq1:1-1437(+)